MKKISWYLLPVACLLILTFSYYSYSNKIAEQSNGIATNLTNTTENELSEVTETTIGQNVLLSLKGKENIVYTPIGDSLTGGYFATTEKDKFTSVLSRLIEKELTTTVEEVGVSSYGGVISGGVKAISVINEAKADLVSIEYGTNDCDPDNNVPINEFESNLNQIIDGITVDVDRDPVIVLVTTWNQGGKCKPFDDAIKKVGTEKDIPVADVEDIWKDNSTKGPAGQETFLGTSDNFHPNNNGMSKIAERIFASLQGIQQDNTEW